MNITFKKLLQIAPFPEDRRKILLENIDKISSDQQYRLENAAWAVMAQIFFAKMEAERKRLADESAVGDRKANPKDLEDYEAKLLSEFAQKLEVVETEESIGEVKQQLKKFQKSPSQTVQPPQADNPPQATNFNKPQSVMKEK